MCCHENQDVIDECNDLFDENGEATFYKIVKISTVGVESFYGDYTWKPGINEAEMLPVQYDPIHPQGLHVCMTEEEADIFVVACLYDYDHDPYEDIIQVIEVVCKKEHFITAGYAAPNCIRIGRQAVFSQLTIIQKDWDRVVQPAIDKIKEDHNVYKP